MRRPQIDRAGLLKAFKEADARGKTALLLSTWFGVGLMPFTPGTFGTVASLPLMALLNDATPPQRGALLLIITAMAVWSSGLSAKILARKDPSEVVIDEVAGFLLAVLFLPASWTVLLLGFIQFRIFDILKPFPIGAVDKNVRGGTGIVLDDLLAGAYAYVGTKLLLTLFEFL